MARMSSDAPETWLWHRGGFRTRWDGLRKVGYTTKHIEDDSTDSKSRILTYGIIRATA